MQTRERALCARYVPIHKEKKRQQLKNKLAKISKKGNSLTYIFRGRGGCFDDLIFKRQVYELHCYRTAERLMVH